MVQLRENLGHFIWCHRALPRALRRNLGSWLRHWHPGRVYAEPLEAHSQSGAPGVLSKAACALPPGEGKFNDSSFFPPQLMNISPSLGNLSFVYRKYQRLE